MFANIENQEIRLPNTISKDAQNLLKQLLTKTPIMRIGAGKNDAADIKCHPFYKEINWELLYKK